MEEFKIKEKIYEMILYGSPALMQFPKSEKYVLASKIRETMYRVFVKRKCEQKGPKKVSTFSTRFHVVSNAFPKYQMLTF